MSPTQRAWKSVQVGGGMGACCTASASFGAWYGQQRTCMHWLLSRARGWVQAALQGRRMRVSNAHHGTGMHALEPHIAALLDARPRCHIDHLLRMLHPAIHMHVPLLQ